MSDFRRRGFIRASYGMLKVARIWHGPTFSEFEDEPGLNEHGPLTAPKLAKLADYTKLVSIVAERLRPFLQDGEVRSFVFNRQLSNLFHKVPCEYWAKPESASMLERLFFEAFETQSSLSQPVPRDSFYFSVSDLTELLEPESARKRLGLDEAMINDLADELRSVSERYPGLHRPDQFKMVRESPKYRRVTDRELRQAAKKFPLRPGRPRKE